MNFVRGASRSFPLLYLDPITTGSAIRDTLIQDATVSQEEAIIEIYRRLRPGDPPDAGYGDESL